MQEAIDRIMDEKLAVVAKAILNDPWVLQVRSFTLYMPLKDRSCIDSARGFVAALDFEIPPFTDSKWRLLCNQFRDLTIYSADIRAVEKKYWPHSFSTLV